MQTDPWTIRVADAVVLDALALEPGLTVLDAGCGTGRHLQPLLASGASVIGVDHSQASLAVAREKAPPGSDDRLDLRVGDVRELPVADTAASRAICVGVLQHLPAEEYRRTAVAELHRVLRPDGVVVVQVYHWGGHVKGRRDGFWGEDLFRHAFTTGELRRLLEGAGFADVEVRGAAILPRVFEHRAPSEERQVRWARTPLAHLAEYLVCIGRAR